MVPAAAPTEVQSLLDVLQGFVHELRAAGLPVSMTENLDAMRALEYVDISDREVFRTVLATTLVKHHRHQRAFDVVFNVYFSLYSHGIDDDELLDAEGPDSGLPQDGQPAAGGGHADVARRARRDADARVDEHGPRGAAAARGARGAAVRGDGARSPRRRHVLPVPHAARARPRGAHRAAHGPGPPAGRGGRGRARRPLAPRGVRGAAAGAARAGRGGDPARARRRSRHGGDGAHAAQAVARKTSSSCTRRATRCSRCSGPSTR